MIGREQLHRQLQAVPRAVRAEITKTLDGVGDSMVAGIETVNPLPGTIVIKHKWEGDVGGAVLATFMGREFLKIRKIIFATAFTEEYPRGGGGFPAITRWFEFGTKLRKSKKTGKESGFIVAQPFFWPVIRANRSRIRSRLSAAVRRGVNRVQKRGR